MDFSEIGRAAGGGVGLLLSRREVLGESRLGKRLNPFMMMNEWCRAARRYNFCFERGTE
jgi:hypothetical protein